MNLCVIIFLCLATMNNIAMEKESDKKNEEIARKVVQDRFEFKRKLHEYQWHIIDKLIKENKFCQAWKVIGFIPDGSYNIIVIYDNLPNIVSYGWYDCEPSFYKVTGFFLSKA